MSAKGLGPRSADGRRCLGKWVRSSELRKDSRTSTNNALLLVLLGADVFHPVDHFAVEFFLDGDVGHGGGGGGAVPMFFARGEPHHIAGADLLDRSTFTLRPAESRRNDQRLSQR